MITLVSRWKLRDGCSPELLEALDELRRRVAEEEPGTLLYLVNLSSHPPLDASERPKVPAPPSIPLELQTEIVFLEAYQDVRAFADHVSGPGFSTFRQSSLHHFYEDPTRPGWPRTDTSFFRPLNGLAPSDPGPD